MPKTAYWSQHLPWFASQRIHLSWILDNKSSIALYHQQLYLVAVSSCSCNAGQQVAVWELLEVIRIAQRFGATTTDRASMPSKPKTIFFGAKCKTREWYASTQHVCANGDSCLTPFRRLLFSTSFSNLRAMSVSAKREGSSVIDLNKLE